MAPKVAKAASALTLSTLAGKTVLPVIAVVFLQYALPI